MSFKYQWRNTLADLPPESWNRLAANDLPFFEYEWLHGLEHSGCVGEEAGWLSNHLLVWDGDKLVAAAPLYIKTHSRGEFVFDQEWAEVSYRVGVDYYPKLLGMSPFTPARGYRFLVDPDLDLKKMSKKMQKEVDRFCKDAGINSCHYLHTDPDWSEMMQGQGVGGWLHHSLVWENRDFKNFDDYLSIFRSKQRKNIKRERRLVQEQGLTFNVIPGEEAPREYFLLMYYLYAATCEKFWGWSQYLNLEFFNELAEHRPERTLLVAAYDEDKEVPVAMSFLARKDDMLFGRYWGCRERYEQLHFETCYYQPIEWAIANGIKHYDSGSGNAMHKQKRGFPAQPNYSLHRHYHPTMDRIWEANIDHVNQVEQQRIQLINRSVKPDACPS